METIVRMGDKTRHALIVSNTASMIELFNIQNIKLLQEMGYTVDVACNFESGNTCPQETILTLQTKLNSMAVSCHNIKIVRSPFSLSNIKAYKELKAIISSKHFDIIHCHTPVGGLLARLAARHERRNGTKVIYTAHGFHFYKGAPLLNWLIYYPVEKILSYWTDILVTINKEDYLFAKNHMNARQIEYIQGIGLDLNKFNVKCNSYAKRRGLTIPDNKVWLLAVGELITRKNHASLIRAIAPLQNIYLTIAGIGSEHEKLQRLINTLHLSHRVKLLGFRYDIPELCEACDIFALPSFQEGLPVALMEAMAFGKPIVCSHIRGNVDLIDNEKGGFLFSPKNIQEIQDALKHVLAIDWERLGNYNQGKIKYFLLDKVLKKLREIYS